MDCIKSINDGGKEEHEGAYTHSIRKKLTSSGRSILVPLTSSLYVPGTLKNAGKVLVDVGTGYYIEKVHDYCSVLLTRKSSGDAIKFYSSKVEFLDKNMSDLEKVVSGKASNAKGIAFGIMN